MPDVSVILRVDGDDELPALRRFLGSLDPEEDVEVVVVHGPGLALPAGVRGVGVKASELPRARAHGLVAATGEAIAFLQPSDRLARGAMTAGRAALAMHTDCAFVFGRVLRPLHGDDGLAVRAVRVDHYVELLRGNFIGPGCAAMFRRGALLASGLAAERAAELDDYALYLRLARTAPVHYTGQLVAWSSALGPDAGAELAALRLQRRHVGSDARAVAAYRAGLAALVAQDGVRIGNDLRDARRRPLRAAGAAARLSGLFLRHPRGTPGFLMAELLPWMSRRRPGWRGLTMLGATTAIPSSPARRLAEAVQHTVPPGEPVVILGREEQEITLTGHAVRFVPPPQWRSISGDVDHLVIPRTSDWELAQRPDARATLGAHWTTIWSDDTGEILRTTASPALPRVLVSGYFSFTSGHATAGDLLVRDEVCGWLAQAGYAYDVAHAAPHPGGVDWRTVEPASYSSVVFVCGPFSPDRPSWELLERFPQARTVGVNLTMLAPLEDWNPFDVLIERDSDWTSRPDVAFGATAPKVPVVGMVLREHAPGVRAADAAIRRLLESSDAAVVSIDTRLDVLDGGRNSTGQRTAAEVESLIARMDVVVTTRLHGLVLALKNGVPVVAVDPGSEGFKIRRQAESVGWPVVLGLDELSDEALRQALEHCLTDTARAQAAECATRASASGESVRRLFLAALTLGDT